MMEVKQSPTVPLMDYVSSNSNSNSVDNSTLLETVDSRKLQIKKPKDDNLIQNGSNIENELDDELDFHDAIDTTEAITSDLEDVLLAEDDLLEESKTNFSLDNLDKAENSTDPGDDLDRLLSKINDIVEGSELTEKVTENATNELKLTEQVNGENIRADEKAKEMVEANVEEQYAEVEEIKAQPEQSNENCEAEKKSNDDSKLETMEVDKLITENADSVRTHEEDIVMAEADSNIISEDITDHLQLREQVQEQDSKQTSTKILVKQAAENSNELETSEEVSMETETIIEKENIEMENDDTKFAKRESTQEAEPKVKAKVLEDNETEALEAKKIDKTTKESDESKEKMEQENAAVNKEAQLPVNKELEEPKEEMEIQQEPDKELEPTEEKKADTELEENKEKSQAVENIETSKEANELKTEEIVSKTDELLKEIENGEKSADDLEEGEIVDDSDDTNKIQVKQNNEIITLTLDDDDDDDVIFAETTTYEKKSDKKTNDDEIVCLDDDEDDDRQVTSKVIENENKIHEIKESEVVSKSQTETVTKEDQTEKLKEISVDKQPNELNADNTDNACDGSEAPSEANKPIIDKPASNNNEAAQPPVEEDARSVDSSSSNLLQEGQAPSETPYEAQEEPEDEDAECEVEDEVELVEEATNVQNKQTNDDDDDIEIPPAKKLRLSVDSDNNKIQKNNEVSNVEKNEDCLIKEIGKSEQLENVEEKLNKPEKMEVDVADEESAEKKSAIKRLFSETKDDKDDAVSKTDEAENILKKPKEISSEVVLAIVENEKKPAEKTEEKSEIDKFSKSAQEDPNEDLLDVKPQHHIAVPSNKPIPLYPPPKFEEEPKKLSLDFLKRFRKTYSQMTRNDLEELVLQKVVESMVYENEFADLRLIIEKQEKVIALHRSKLAQLVKQYRDLEMVHTRVVKDMREKNSQYLMPVRITRAVGLQVSSPNSRKDAAAAPLATQTVTVNNVAGTNNLATGSSTMTNNTNMRAPQTINNNNNNNSINSIQQQKRITSPQRAQQANNNSSTPTLTSSVNTAAAAAGGAAAQPVRRGCMQKITAPRPVNGSNKSSTAPPPMASIPSSSYARPMQSKPSISSQSTTDQSSSATRVLNKNAQTIVNARPRYSSSGNSPSPVQQTKSPPQLIHRQPSAPNNNNAKIHAALQNKIAQNAQLRRSESSPSVGTSNSSKPTSSSYMDQYQKSFNQAMTSIPNVSITPARPKDKSVIDLTDEDDLPATPPPTMTPRNRVSLQGQSNASTSSSAIRQNVPPLTRMPNAVSTRPQIAPRQLSSLQAQKAASVMPATITTPSGMSITRVSVNQTTPATQRIRYTHPAPLPSTPPQAFNASWKLPPPRPTIRISNLDNGIVISWTMEEALDRHADVTTYQIYAYQETNSPPSVESWRHVGDVKAMLLPMAVTLTQFQEDQRYYFSVRAMDTHQRYGAFSAPKTWN